MAEAENRFGLASVEVERKLPFVIEVGVCHSSQGGIRECDDRQSTSWPLFSNLSRRAFSAHRTLGRFSPSRLAARNTARAVCSRPWSADVGGLPWDVDRPRTGSGIEPRMALRDSNLDGSELANNYDRATGSTERYIGQRGELAPADGFYRALPPIPSRAFRRHGRERDRMVCR